ncbi:MAG: LLM class flavin-dependent oxidoreductase [Dehalococcoidia bacterium]
MSQEIKVALKLNMYGHALDTSFEAFQRLALQAEAVGFDGVFAVDHLHFPAERIAGYTQEDPTKPYFLETWTALAALAAVTTRVRLGPQVSPLTFRHPAMLAKMGNTIDHISRGRLILQLGTGWQKEEHQAYGLPFDERFAPRYQRLLEGVEVIKRLWTEAGPVGYQGQHFTLEGASFWPKPVQRPHPPIWFGGSGRKMRAVVAQYGDGWCPAMPHHAGVGLEAYQEGLREIRELAQAHGRDPDGITPGILYPTAIHGDRAKAAEMASSMLRRADFAHFSLEGLRSSGIVLYGNPDDCVRSLEAYVKAGVRYFTLNFVPFSDLDAAMRGMELYATRVLPRVSPV